MRVTTQGAIILFSGATSALLIALAGCESNSTGMAVTPSSITLRHGESADFEASGGGSEYEWSLAEESWGRLSSRTGSKVTYTSLYSGKIAPVVQTLTAISWVPDNSHGADGSDSTMKEVSAQAAITQLQVFPDAGSVPSSITTTTTTTTSTSTTTTTTSGSTTTTTSSGPPAP